MDKLNTAIDIAIRAHEGQLDMGGVLYILHPLRVMLKMKTLEARVVAVLHDTIEDSKGLVTAETLARDGFSPAVVDAVVALTRRPGEDYLGEFIPRIAKNEIARVVKLGDLADNMDPARPRPGAGDKLKVKYEMAKAFLEGRLWR